MTSGPKDRTHEPDDLDGLDTQTVEDLDAEQDAEDVRGGTTWHCMLW